MLLKDSERCIACKIEPNYFLNFELKFGGSEIALQINVILNLCNCETGSKIQL